jgi:hypothetical protein
MFCSRPSKRLWKSAAGLGQPIPAVPLNPRNSRASQIDHPWWDHPQIVANISWELDCFPSLPQVIKNSSGHLAELEPLGHSLTNCLVMYASYLSSNSSFLKNFFMYVCIVRRMIFSIKVFVTLLDYLKNSSGHHLRCLACLKGPCFFFWILVQLHFLPNCMP